MCVCVASATADDCEQENGTTVCVGCGVVQRENLTCDLEYLGFDFKHLLFLRDVMMSPRSSRSKFLEFLQVAKSSSAAAAAAE